MSRYEAILRQSRLLSSSPDYWNIVIQLEEENDVAHSIAKMTRQCTPGLGGIFIPMLGGITQSTSEPEVFLQGALKEAPELVVSVSIVASVVTSKNQSGYEPLNLENRSFVNSDMTYNFAATDFRL